MLRAKFIDALVSVLAVALALLMPGRVAQAATKYKLLHSFNANVDGSYPGALALGGAGRLYGAGAGPPSTYGMVFELAPGAKGWTLSLLYTFNNWKVDGADPNTPLVFDNAGALYGTTITGGGTFHEGGLVFKLAPGTGRSWEEEVLYVFCSFDNCQDGGAPWAGAVWDQVGNLYGTTFGGGLYSAGAVFQLSPEAGGWTETVRYSFNPSGSRDGTDGESPKAGVVLDASGNLYGTTIWGGNYSKCSGSLGCGIVFQLTPTSGGSWQENVLHRFAQFTHDGQVPYTGVTLDSKGDVYGVTAGGGIYRGCPPGGCGVVFKLAKNQSGQWKETILHAFDFTHGGGPFGTLVFGKAGNLYGTAVGGGKGPCSAGCGLVFKLSPTKKGRWKYTILHEFTGPDGANPDSGVIFDRKGNLFGTTQRGGAYGGGVVFELTP